jgi:hypothetical protein
VRIIGWLDLGHPVPQRMRERRRRSSSHEPAP